MSRRIRCPIAPLASLLAAVLMLGPAAAVAQPRGGGGHGGYDGRHGGAYPARGYGYGYGGWGVGPYWGGVGLGIGIGLGSAYYGGRYGYGYGYGYGYPYAYPWYPGFAVVEAAPPVVYYGAAAHPVAAAPPAAAPAPPPPIIYPRNGQSPEQTEADRRDCNRWAVTQQNAISDASVFQRATAACMDGRGYTLK